MRRASADGASRAEDDRLPPWLVAVYLLREGHRPRRKAAEKRGLYRAEHLHPPPRLLGELGRLVGAVRSLKLQQRPRGLDAGAVPYPGVDGEAANGGLTP